MKTKFRLNAEAKHWLKIAQEELPEKSQDDLLNHLVVLGAQAVLEQAIDEYIENPV